VCKTTPVVTGTAASVRALHGKIKLQWSERLEDYEPTQKNTVFTTSASNPTLLPGYRLSEMQPEHTFSSELLLSWEGQRYGTPRKGGATEL